MEELTAVWQYIVPIFSGITLAGIVSAVIYACLKGAFSRLINKINVKEIAKKATDEGVERSLEKIKDVSFKQSIQPLVESELKKIEEMAKQTSKEELVKVQEQYNKLLDIIEAFAHYFDNSIGVVETAKEDLKTKIADARTAPEIAENEIVVEFAKEEEKKDKKQKKSNSDDVLL